MDLGEACEVGWSDVPEIAFIDDAIGYVSLFDEFAQPRRGLGVEFGVESGHRGHASAISTPQNRKLSDQVMIAARRQ